MWFLCSSCRGQHPEHSLLGDVRDEGGAAQPVRSPALVFLSVSPSGDPGNSPVRSAQSCGYDMKPLLSRLCHRRCPLSAPPDVFAQTDVKSLLQPDVHPGNCWAFRGATGFLVIRLSMRVLPSAFTLEHIPKALAPSGTLHSAPRDFAVYVRERWRAFINPLLRSLCVT